MHGYIHVYSAPLHFKTTRSARKYGLGWKVSTFKWKDIYTENIRHVLLMAGLKIEGIVNWRGSFIAGTAVSTCVCTCIVASLWYVPFPNEEEGSK